MTLPELDRATWPPVSTPRVSPQGTHLGASQDVVHVERLEQGPELKVDLDDASLKVESTRHGGFDSHGLFGPIADKELKCLARSGRVVIENTAHLAESISEGLDESTHAMWYLA